MKTNKFPKVVLVEDNEKFYCRRLRVWTDKKLCVERVRAARGKSPCGQCAKAAYWLRRLDNAK